MEPLGDQAVLLGFQTEAAAARFAEAARQLPPPWQLDTVLAYRSVAVFFDLYRTNFAEVSTRLQDLPVPAIPCAANIFTVPCCYDLGPDLERVAAALGLSSHEVIRLHSSCEYVVYAIGFVPGFPYLGYLPAALRGVPRLEQPRLRVEPGSVGLTGRQTAIYPQASPGGWPLIGRTPLEIVNVADGYFPFRPGDTVRFVPISAAEFARRRGGRLATSPKKSV